MTMKRWKKLIVWLLPMLICVCMHCYCILSHVTYTLYCCLKVKSRYGVWIFAAPTLTNTLAAWSTIMLYTSYIHKFHNPYFENEFNGYSNNYMQHQTPDQTQAWLDLACHYYFQMCSRKFFSYICRL